MRFSQDRAPELEPSADDSRQRPDSDWGVVISGLDKKFLLSGLVNMAPGEAFFGWFGPGHLFSAYRELQVRGAFFRHYLRTFGVVEGHGGQYPVSFPNVRTYGAYFI